MIHTVKSVCAADPIVPAVAPLRRPRLWRRMTRRAWTRPVRVSGAFLIACVLTTPAYAAPPVTWLGGTSDWHTTPANWSSGAFPGATDDVQNNTASATITYSSSANTINSFLSAGAFNLTGGSLTANTATSTFNVNNTFTLGGGTLNGFLVGGQGIQVANNTNNRLNGVTINSILDLSTNGSSFVQVDSGGLTVNGTANINNGGRLYSNANQTFGGTGNIVFGANGGTLYTPNGLLTLGNSLTIRGQNGTLQGNFINNGLISANVNGGTLSLTSSNLTNNNAMQAINGATLSLVSSTVSNNGTLTAGNGSVISADSVTINGGTENGAGALRFTNNTNNRLNGATINGILDLSTNANSFLQVDSGGLTVNGTANINNGGRLYSNANQTLGGTGNIVFGSGGGTLYTPNGVLTIDSGLTVRGLNGTLQGSFINNGLITSDSGGTMTIANSGVTNNSTLRATNGSTLALVSTTLSNNGTLDTATSGLVTVDNTTINGGTVAGTGTLRFTNNTNNRLNAAVVNSALDLSTNGSAFLQVDSGGLTLNGTATIDNGGRLYSNANQTLGGNGAIVFGATSGGLLYTPNGVLTIGNNLTVRGQNGTLQGSFINNGLITSDSGGTMTIANSGVTNNSTLRATNGSTLALVSTTLSNNGTLDTATSGLVTVDNTTINGGTVAGTGTLRFTNNTNNRLNGVTVNSMLDLSTNGSAFVQVDGNGLILNNKANIDNGGRLYSNANQTFGGNGSIVFGANGGLLYTPNGTLTLDTGLTVRGQNGTLQGSFINNGLISADVNGGTISVNSSGVTNNAKMQAVNGATLALNSMTLTNNGTLTAGSGSVISVDNTTINGGTENGAGALRFTNNGNNRLNGATINGILDLSTNANSFLQVDSGGLTLNGTANINNGGRLFSNANQTFGGTGNIVFGSGGGTLYTPNGLLTTRNALTIRGQNGTIQANLVNGGKISADVSGGTINVVNGFGSSGTVEAINGGNLAVGGAVTSSGVVHTGAGSHVSMTSLTQSAGSTLTDGTLALNNGSGALIANGGTVSGSGTIQGSVTINSGATMRPSLGLTALNITGPYTQNAGGIFFEELGGITPGSQFGQLNASGAAFLAGGSILDVMVDSGFSASVGQTFDIFNYASLSGTFGSIVSFTPGYTFSFFDDGSGQHGLLKVTAAPAAPPPVNVPEPGTWALLGAGLVSGLAFTRRRRTRS